MNLLVNLNKRTGITSNEALIETKRAFNVRKAGHGGTLDPLAEGVLIIALNEATKILPYLSGLDKEYLFTAHLGVITETFDAEGAVVEERSLSGLKESLIEEVLVKFTGNITQRPPRYSAIKLRGRPLYDYARKGIVVEPAPRTVSIHKIKLVDCSMPFVTFRVVCSTGTYIRSLCHDIGLALGVGAHIAMLRRTKIGPFNLDNATAIEHLPKGKLGLFSIDDALSHMPYLQLPKDLTVLAQQGVPIELTRLGGIPQDLHNRFKDDAEKPCMIRLLDERHQTFAIGQASGAKIKIKRVLHLKG